MLRLDPFERDARDDRLHTAHIAAHAHPLVAVDGQVPELRGDAVAAQQDLSVDHHGVADAGAEIDARHAVLRGDAEVLEVEEQQVVDVPVDEDRDAERGFERVDDGEIVRDTGDVRGLHHDGARAVDGGRKADRDGLGHLSAEVAPAVAADARGQLLRGVAVLQEGVPRALPLERRQPVRPVHQAEPHIRAADINPEHIRFRSVHGLASRSQFDAGFFLKLSFHLVICGREVRVQAEEPRGAEDKGLRARVIKPLEGFLIAGSRRS